MNPLIQFEKCARKVWSSDLPPRDKAHRLREVHDAIAHYVVRLNAQPKEDGDLWNSHALSRAKAYLSSLARDVEGLAAVCERKGNGRARGTTYSSMGTIQA